MKIKIKLFAVSVICLVATACTTSNSLVGKGKAQWINVYQLSENITINSTDSRKVHDFKEVQISEEKRLDVVITFYQHKYIVELKRWYGPKSHDAGLGQLVDYLDRQHQQNGYLVIFEYRTKKTWRAETIALGGKEIFAVWI